MTISVAGDDWFWLTDISHTASRACEQSTLLYTRVGLLPLASEASSTTMLVDTENLVDLCMMYIIPPRRDSFWSVRGLYRTWLLSGG